jgi:hypothetical protein
MPDADRTVHAACGEWQVVRYDRAGRWFVEYDPPRMRPATPLSVRQAARLAVRMEAESGGYIYEGRGGGRIFDARVRELKAEE